MKRILGIFSPFFHSALVVLIASLFVMSIVYAATTIGTNITTGGNLTVTGRASTTSATSTAYLMVGGGITAPPGFDFADDLSVNSDVFIGNKATSTVALWVGSAGTANNINLAGGDLYVKDGVEIDGGLYVSGVASTTSVTSTAYIVIGGAFTLPSSFNYTDDLAVNGDAIFNGKATTTSLWVGPLGSGTATSTTAASGDLFVDNSAEVKNKLYVGGGLFALNATKTPTSTKGLMVGPTIGTSTTTVGIGDEQIIGCLELTQRATPATAKASWYACTIDPNATPPVLTCYLGRCN